MTHQSDGPELAWAPDQEDIAFYDVYGDWDPLTPPQLAELMDGFPEPWWLVGGHSIETFTGVRRFHEDIDLVVFADAVPALRAQVGSTYHLWGNDGGTLRVIDDDRPEPIAPLAQIWMRENARAPWRVDCILNPKRDGRWQSRRHADLVADLDEVTWVAADGVRYMNPEVSLLFKAKQNREKDRVDLDNAWPLMSTEQRAWLRDHVRRYHPDHPWQERLDRG